MELPLIAAMRWRVAAVRRFADRATWKPGIPEGIPRTATMRPNDRNVDGAGDYAPSKLIQAATPGR